MRNAIWWGSWPSSTRRGTGWFRSAARRCRARYELTYSFDREYRFTNLRITVTPDETVPSISVIYPNAFLYENEIHDLFGVPITHIAVDYRGTLYRTALGTPFSVENVKLPEPPKQKARRLNRLRTAKGEPEVPGGEQKG